MGRLSETASRRVSGHHSGDRPITGQLGPMQGPAVSVRRGLTLVFGDE